MKHSKSFIFYIAMSWLLVADFVIANDCCEVEKTKNCNFSKNLWQPRAFSSYSSREILMLKDLYDHPFKHDQWDGTISFATEYIENIKTKNPETNLGAMPFWSGTNSMKIGNNDGSSDVDAYQFGMGNVIKQGSISLNPKVQQIGTDFLLHFTRYKHDRGFFFKLKIPVGVIKIDANVYENSAELSEAVDENWLMYPPYQARYDSLSQAFAGGTAGEDFVIGGSLNKPLALDFGRISCCELKSVRVGDLTASVGYNILADEHYYLGVGVKGSFPTGTVPTGKFIFEPIFGRAGQWTIGIDLTGHYKHWLNEQEGKSLDFWIQSEVLNGHNGRKPNWRSFDLKKNGPGSKYMLVQFYFPANPTPENSTGRVPSFITQAINLTTLPVLSSFLVEGALSAMIEYSDKNWTSALAVDLWGRSSECLKIDTCNLVNENSQNLNDFAVLGRQISEENSGSSNAIPLYYCEPCAKINKSINRVLSQENVPNGVKDARISSNRIPESLYEALDIEGAAEGRVVSIKLTPSFGYAWRKSKCSPVLNIFTGFEVTSYNSLRVYNWSVGVQAAFNF